MIDRPQPPVNGTQARRGAYGVAVTGLEAEDRLLVAAESDWPTVLIRVEASGTNAGGALLDEDMARYVDAAGGHVVVDRRAGVASFRGADPPTSDEIVHPGLGMLGALYAQWAPGRMAFHAGAFINGERAWAVVGKRHDGKSTLMAALALAGVPVLGDDTLVLDGVRCLSGVRCVDLRPDAPAQLGVPDNVFTVRRGARERLLLDGQAREAPLAGWFFLRWADEVAIRVLETPERIARIASCQGWHRRGVTDPERLLDLAALPAWELSRPRDWAHLPRVLEHVRELTR
ncbi:MAG: hypothetical protein QOF55_2314 [Thermoleophilaceae bacterium]|nr:hypothetical protein [Thermoleophilaceae bacterium]